MATIYEHIQLSPDNKLGYIDEDGDIYGYGEYTGEEEHVGRVDYEEGLVYLLEDDDTEIVLGWIADENKIVASFEEEDVEIGYITDEGKLYYYIDENDAEYIGSVTDMTDPVEGAAALLLFFEFEDEDEDE